MAVFPMVSSPIEPVTISVEFNTKKTVLQGGLEYRRQYQERPKRKIKIKYEKITASDMATIWDFYCARKGSLEPFYYIFPVTESWSNEYLIKSNGSTKIVDLHCNSYSTVSYTHPTYSIEAYLQAKAGYISSVYYNGLIYFYGSYPNYTNAKYMQVYNPTTKTIQVKADAGVNRLNFTNNAILYNNKIYFFGGRHSTSNTTYYNDFLVYDITANSWSTITGNGTTPSIRSANTVLINDNIYILGGYYYNGSTYYYYNDCFKFNITTETFSQISSLPANRALGITFIYNGDIYYYGGTNGSSTQSTLYKYTISNDTWTTVNTTNAIANQRVGMCLFNNYLYTFGNYSSTYATQIRRLNLNTFAWETLPTALPFKLYANFISQNNNLLYMFGGYDFTNYRNEIMLFNIEEPSIITSSEGMKQLQYTNNIPAGHKIYGSFADGKPMLLVRFADDNLSRDVFSLMLQTTGIELEEVLV